MPIAEVYFYQDDDGSVPVVEWLTTLFRTNEKAYIKCAAKIERLEEEGYDLRRPEADTLRDGIKELRIRNGHVHYRILYFAHGKDIFILGHALTKEDIVPPRDIEIAIERRERLRRHPEKHIFYGHDKSTNDQSATTEKAQASRGDHTEYPWKRSQDRLNDRGGEG